MSRSHLLSLADSAAPVAASDRQAAPALWQSMLALLEQQLPAKQIQTWLKPLQVRDLGAEPGMEILVASRFKLEWIRAQYYAQLVQAYEQLGGSGPLRLALASARASAPANSRGAQTSKPVLPLAAALTSDVVASGTDEGVQQRHADSVREPNKQAQGRETAKSHQSRLNPDLNFATLVEGSANRMARAAALHVAAQPGKVYNPLFIYGASGLGKTHLLHAIGNQYLKDHPKAKVLCVHAVQFVTDVVQAYQRKTFEQFKSYYHSLDLLLLDDVQNLAGKERTQEEFFNAFEALLSKQSHVVMTSDTYPKALANVPDRLVSRFASGLTVAIEPPELEMRVAILLSKAQQEQVALDEDVAFFIAKNVRSNVRELEGALRMVVAYARFNHRDITVATTREALRDLLSAHNRQITVENIQKTVADFYKIKVADMHSKKRPAAIAKPRQIAMYLAKEMTQKSLPEIGEQFGGRDHTTVLHAVKKIVLERQQNTELNQQIHLLEQTLKG